MVLFFVHWQPVHIVTLFPVFHPCFLLDCMFFSFPELVNSFMFLTEWGNGACFHTSYMLFLCQNQQKRRRWCPCHDPTLMLLEEQALQGWGSKNWNGGEGMMTGICQHKKRSKKCLCLRVMQLEPLRRIPLESKHLAWLAGLCELKYRKLGTPETVGILLADMII